MTAVTTLPIRALGEAPRPRRRFLIIHNPVAGARRARVLHAVSEALAVRFDAEVMVRPTAGRGHAEEIARDMAADACDAVVAAGGDGTINEVINGLAARGPAAAAVPLGLVPLGTANVLANELGLSFSVNGIAEVLARGVVREVHLGTANGRCFTMMAGAGLDAHVVEKVDTRLKRLTGKGAYVVETLAQLMKPAEGRRYRVTVGEQSWEVASVIIANGRFYGGRFVCAPEARLTDGTLHVCLFPGAGRWNALRYVWGVTMGRLKHFRDYRIIPAERVAIAGVAGEAVQGDGDVIARLPAEVSLVPWRLPVLVPRN